MPKQKHDFPALWVNVCTPVAFVELKEEKSLLGYLNVAVQL